MKSKEEITNELGILTFNEVKRLEVLCNSLQSIAEKKTITEDTLKDVTNAYSELYILKESITKRLITCLKQGHMLD